MSATTPRSPERRAVLRQLGGAGVGLTLLSPAWLLSAPSRPAGLPPGAFPLDDYVDHIQAGGPPKDGIPAIDEPVSLDATAADDFLEPWDVVFGVVRNGEARAYPQRILVWHEIVNDRIGGDNLAVTYCPLTGTAMGYFRGDTTFGVSGQLVNSNLIMYDRATDSYWPQILGAAIRGERRGGILNPFQLTWTRWRHWKAVHPDTRVLSRDTGYARDYSRDPYGGYEPRRGYYSPDSGPLFPVMKESDRLPAKTVVIAARTPGGPLAFRKDALRDAGALTTHLGGETYVGVHDARLDAGLVYRAPQGIDPEAGDIELRPDGVHQGERHLALEPAVAFDAFWFAWAAFFPDARLHG